jgi:hypothetical protein
VEYLNGWIVIKKLLQITSVGEESGEGIDCEEKEEAVLATNHTISNKKLSKKTIVIRKLQLDYEK